jgi:hypothetical protein
VGAVVLGDDHDATGFLVEAMDDARTADASNAGETVAAMGQKRIDERAGGIARARMDDETGRLVDDLELPTFRKVTTAKPRRKNLNLDIAGASS